MAIRSITFTNGRDRVKASVGQPLRWGRPGPDGEVRAWKSGPRVLEITEGATHEVWWDPADAPSEWNNPIRTGHPIELLED